MQQVYEEILSWAPDGRGSKDYLIQARTVQELFNHSRLLRIPDYQRPYSWTEKNIKDLLNDVHKLSQTEEPHNGEDRSWFFGPIFSVRKTDLDDEVDLLDGQQRITTIQILLREITLFLIRENPFDFSDHKELENKLEEAILSCKECLTRRIGMSNVPKFQTESSVKAFFDYYILNFNKIEDYNDLKSKRKTLKSKADEEKKKGSKTAWNIYDSTLTVQNFLEKKFYKKAPHTFEGLEELYYFIEGLLTRCWLIEIPLQDHDDSIQIFESINNRGKQLTLVDKLRYKTLINAKNLNFIRDNWKKIYAGLEFLLDKNFIKAEDDFFKVFFLAVTGENLTKEEEHLEVFETRFLKDENSIESFLKESLIIIDFYKNLNDPLSASNEFVDVFSKKEKDKVKALMRLFNKVLKESDNSRFLLFYLLRKYSDFLANKYIIVQSLWNIIRIVCKHEIFDNLKSNKVRTEYLELIKGYNKGKSEIVNAENILNYSIKFQNIIKNADNSEAQILIYLYTYLNDFQALICYSAERYSNSQLDHLFPRAWIKHWSDYQYKVEEVFNYIKDLESDSPELFKNYEASKIINEINSIDVSDFELKDYKTGTFKQPDSLIEYIGNKWVLSGVKNAGSGNKSFEDKKEYYQDERYVKVPVNDNKLCGIDLYQDFSYKEIIQRSLIILNGIVENYKNNWDHIN